MHKKKNGKHRSSTASNLYNFNDIEMRIYSFNLEESC